MRQASLYATEVQNESSEFGSVLRTSFRFLDEVDVKSKNLLLELENLVVQCSIT